MHIYEFVKEKDKNYKNYIHCSYTKQRRILTLHVALLYLRQRKSTRKT